MSESKCNGENCERTMTNQIPHSPECSEHHDMMLMDGEELEKKTREAALNKDRRLLAKLRNIKLMRTVK